MDPTISHILPYILWTPLISETPSSNDYIFKYYRSKRHYFGKMSQKGNAFDEYNNFVNFQ